MDLYTYIKRQGAFSMMGLRRSMNQLISGASYCNVRGILHRDLKPQNLLVNTISRKIKVADFRLCRFACTSNRPYTPDVGTLWYRAPEILLGMEEYGTGVDVWSLGCILAQMAT